MTAPPVPPVRRSVLVPWNVETAFARFTTGFADWWPRRTHSIGGARVRTIKFECRAGGLIVEELVDGRRFKWGEVTAFDPPHRVAFTWHPSRDEHDAQDVEVRFVAEGSGTRVELISTGWERLGAAAARARRMYGIGWGSVLAVFAGRRDVPFVLFSVISTAITGALRVTGRLESEIDKAGGKLPARSS